MIPTYSTPIEKYMTGESEKRPTKTFKIDWESGRLLSKTIEGTEAIAQAVKVRTCVEQYEAEMMPETFGIALKELYDEKGDPMPRDFVLANLKRIIAEALAPDMRIKKISKFSVEPHKNHVNCYLEIECDDGIFETEIEVKHG